MTQEEKELLIKDLSVRTPYKVKASYYGTDEEMECTDIVEGVIIDNNDAEIIIGQYGLSVEKVKPYLFPLSSMTEEQLKELQEIIGNLNEVCISVNTLGLELWLNPVGTDPAILLDFVFEIQDWLNAHHFDFRGLIPMGLANDATGLNIY